MIDPNKKKLRKILEKIRRRALAKQYEYDLDMDWIVATLSSEKCSLTGIPFVDHNGGMEAFGPSIDRIDSQRGYTKDNCQFILTILNFAKGEWNYDVLYKWATEFIEAYEENPK